MGTATETTSASAVVEGPTLPPLSAEGSWRALLAPEGRKALEATLGRYIAACRWFRGKARTRRSVKIADVVPLARYERAPAQHYVLLVRVEYTDGAPDTYVVPVGFAAGDKAKELMARSRHAIIASVAVSNPEPELAAE